MELKKLTPWNWFKKEEEHILPIDTPYDRGRDDALEPSLRRYHADFHDFLSAFLHHPLIRTPAMLPDIGILKPSLDLRAEEKEYILTIEIPGVDEKDVSITINNDTLTVKGTKQREEEVKEENFYRIERGYGSFQRVLSLPEDVDRDGIEATCKKGVLTISMPRKKTVVSTSKTIEIT